jgi:hypothetical protein
MKTEIVCKLDDMERYGMLPSRLAFLRLMASLYGIEVLRETNLPWVSTIEHPGNTAHRSHGEVVTRLSHEHHVMCGTGMTAKVAYSILNKMSVTEGCQIPVIAIPVDEFEVGYQRKTDLEREYKNGRLTGRLAAVCHTAQVETTRLVLLSAVLRVVAEAWGAEPQVFEEQDWTLDFNKNFLLAVLERPT